MDHCLRLLCQCPTKRNPWDDNSVCFCALLTCRVLLRAQICSSIWASLQAVLSSTQIMDLAFRFKLSFLTQRTRITCPSPESIPLHSVPPVLWQSYVFISAENIKPATCFLPSLGYFCWCSCKIQPSIAC